MLFVYILRCADGSYYVGRTHDLRQRLDHHNEGRAAAHTATRRPVTMVYAEDHATDVGALNRERQMKRSTREKKEALIAGNLQLLRRLSVRRATPGSGSRPEATERFFDDSQSPWPRGGPHSAR